MKILGVRDCIEQEIIKYAINNGIEKVIIFGSRARGDFKRFSDIDLAVTGGNITKFVAEVNEDTSTLLEFDIVNMDGSIQEELRNSIQKEGIILYEKV